MVNDQQALSFRVNVVYQSIMRLHKPPDGSKRCTESTGRDFRVADESDENVALSAGDTLRQGRR